MDRCVIEHKAGAVLDEICRAEQMNRPGLLSRMQMLEPERVAEHLGYQIVYYDSLGQWGRGADRFETAGVLDQQRKLIAVSLSQGWDVARFTAAHEIGHIVLEHPGTTIHRERPVFEVNERSREPQERDADYFAACLLVPRALLLKAFRQRFGKEPLLLDDNTAFELCGNSAHAVMRAGPDSLQFAAAVACARRFCSLQFRSLADAFNVSTSAMAYRIREVGLLND